MATMNISLPDELKQFVDEQVAAHAYGSSIEALSKLRTGSIPPLPAEEGLSAVARRC